MTLNIAEKIAAAILKERHDRWKAMTDAQREAVFVLQAKINRLAMAYIGGNTTCAACGAEAYHTSKVAGGLAAITSCSACDEVEIGQ
jgi:hypothetical protein